MLSLALAVGAFAILLAVVSSAGIWLSNALEKIGARLRFPEALLGLLTALGADAPEIASAVAALRWNHHDMALGVVLGSNIFNLAGLLGVSALVAGRVEMGRHGLLINGGVGLLATAAIAALIFGSIPAWSCLLLLAVLLVPYISLSSLQSAQIRRLPLPGALTRFLGTAVEHAHRNARKRESRPQASVRDAGVLMVCIVLIVACSAGLVRIAVALAREWSVPEAVVGTLVLAALTSIPNVAAAMHLAREGRGAAVVSETFNSNTFNALAGICLPALAFGIEKPSGLIEFSLVWLIAMSLVAAIAAGLPGGLHRRGGTVIAGMYLIFAATMVAWA